MNVQPHSHAVELDDAFEFVNTLEFDGVAIDHLGTPADAIAWLVGHGLLHDGAVPPAPPVLEHVHRVRAGLRDVIDAVVDRRAPNPAALDEVNRALRAREIVQLEPASDGVLVGHRHEGDPVDDALARLAEPVVAEIVGGRPDRLRVCANDRCRWVFYDASPTGRRRWCSMASCGNRAKAARHRARRRGAAPDAIGEG